MTCYCKTPLVYSEGRAAWSQACTVLRGLLAVAVMLLTALDEVVTALLGMPALTPRLRYWSRVIADEYRIGAAGAVDADVIDDTNDSEGGR